MEYVYSNKPSKIALDEISLGLSQRLENGEKILLLISGGSCIGLVVEIVKKLNSNKLPNLSITLVDERYGKLGHKNENWQQLIDAGFVQKQIDTYRPLTDETIEITAKRYNDWLLTHLKQADYKIGLFGVGTDGHTAGIKPGSAAVNSKSLVTHYVGEDYERVTITPKAIRQLDEAIIYTVGDEKRKVLSDLLNDDIPIGVMPAQVLKEVFRLTIYTNNKEEELNL